MTMRNLKSNFLMALDHVCKTTLSKVSIPLCLNIKFVRNLIVLLIMRSINETQESFVMKGLMF
jgi:hypothetical protein